MRKIFRICLSFTLPILFFSCSVFRKNGDELLSNGIYNTSKPGGKMKKNYVVIEDSSIKIYALINHNTADSAKLSSWKLEEYLHNYNHLRLTKGSFDIDVLTIPFKLRPSVKGFPNQLNTNFSGAVYAGYRTDRWRVRYKKDPLGRYIRKENHLGYSLGVFSGFGSTAVNPWVTQNIVSSEYDGLVFLNGIAGIVAVNSFSFGIGLGIDNLLDKNKNAWIYNNKPWIGLTVGLNLN